MLVLFDIAFNIEVKGSVNIVLLTVLMLIHCLVNRILYSSKVFINPSSPKYHPRTPGH